jgi:hypothetical protein
MSWLERFMFKVFSFSFDIFDASAKKIQTGIRRLKYYSHSRHW